jgi:peptidoglycan/xylan/chitin deacetylase (PgdA/CDA1 family)
LPLFRAPGGKTSRQLLASARACGFTHVGWSPAGFLGDELPSETHSNEALLKKALREVRSGDILLAHLGIWSRKDAWAPAVLEPLIQGFKERGFCFRTLREHPVYGPPAGR